MYRVINLFRSFLILVLGITSGHVFGQAPLDKYVREGLESNLALRQKNISLERAVYALKIANSHFLPSLSFSSGYTHGQGGRAIALPVGDLLNPVYATLNQLTESPDFPQIQNVEQTFFPSNFVDAHIRAAMPLLNTDLLYYKKIQQDQVLLGEYELTVLERELVKNIKQAYFSYLSALEVEKIYNGALVLVQRNLEVNQSLLKNGKGLPATLLRAESELENVKVQLFDARNQVNNARRYFNFLLNKPQESFIEAPASLETALHDIPALLLTPASGVAKREELQMIKTGERMNNTLLRMNRNFWMPKVNVFMDLGTQAENWNWNGQSRYYLAGLSLDVPIFNGLRNQYKVRQASLEVKESQLKLQETTQQLELAAEVSRNNLGTAWQNYLAAAQRLKASQGYFRLIEKGYAQGAHSLIEFIDARNQLTTAQLQQTIQTYGVLSMLAQYERETTAYPINPLN